MRTTTLMSRPDADVSRAPREGTWEEFKTSQIDGYRAYAEAYADGSTHPVTASDPKRVPASVCNAMQCNPSREACRRWS